MNHAWSVAPETGPISSSWIATSPMPEMVTALQDDALSVTSLESFGVPGAWLLAAFPVTMTGMFTVDAPAGKGNWLTRRARTRFGRG